MTIYGGETITFKTSATGIDDAQTALTDSDVLSALITIRASDDTEVVTDGAMTYDATDGEWRYTWTTPAGADKYVAKLRLVGATFDTWEFQKVTVKATTF